MTDVIFLLLIFLLIASNFAAQTGLPSSCRDRFPRNARRARFCTSSI